VYDDAGRDRTWRVTAVVHKGGETIVTVTEESAGGTHQAEKVAVSADGVRRLSVLWFEVEPTYYLKTPVRAGDTWDVHMKSQKGFQGVSGTMTVGKEEDIEVPAGKFRAVPVHAAVTPLGPDGEAVRAEERYTRWFAAGVGVVKMTYPDGRVRVLKSFTPGKKD
jgi:hypothetical protein